MTSTGKLQPAGDPEPATRRRETLHAADVHHARDGPQGLADSGEVLPAVQLDGGEPLQSPGRRLSKRALYQAAPVLAQRPFHLTEQVAGAAGRDPEISNRTVDISSLP